MLSPLSKTESVYSSVPALHPRLLFTPVFVGCLPKFPVLPQLTFLVVLGIMTDSPLAFPFQLNEDNSRCHLTLTKMQAHVKGINGILGLRTGW